jgi:hypothetical protein
LIIGTLGGGTAMILQINHRESNDVDIFFPDAQLLSFLDPQKRDFDFEIRPRDYRSPTRIRTVVAGTRSDAH